MSGQSVATNRGAAPTADLDQAPASIVTKHAAPLAALPAPRLVVVCRFGAAGDIVLTGCATAALAAAWPQTKILYVTKEVFAGLAAGLPGVSQVESLAQGGSMLALCRRVASLRPDAILDLHTKARSWVLRARLWQPWRSDRPRRTASWTKRTLAETIAVRFLRRPYNAQMHLATRFHQAVERMAGAIPASLPRQPLSYTVAAHDRVKAQQLLQSTGWRFDDALAASPPLVAIAPGAAWATKRWPVDRFAVIVARLLNHGARVVLTGSSKEAGLTQSIMQHSDVIAAIARKARCQRDASCNILDLAGRLELTTLAAVIQRAQAVLANDSGPMHIARALQVPTLALFGSTDPKQFIFDQHRMIFTQPSCGPCSFHGLRHCPKGHFKCMMHIHVDDVWQALQALLAQYPRGTKPLPVLA